MDQRRYSMKEVQKMIQLSPMVLQDLIKKYRQQLNLETYKGPDGEESFIDHPSLERLMFLKQLDLRQQSTHAEIVSQLAETRSENSEKKGPPVSLEKVFFIALDAISKEVRSLSDTLQQILLRYSHVLNDLNHCRTENQQMSKELEILRARQNIIIGQMKNEEALTPEEIKDKSIIN